MATYGDSRGAGLKSTTSRFADDFGDLGVLRVHLDELFDEVFIYVVVPISVTALSILRRQAGIAWPGRRVVVTVRA